MIRKKIANSKEILKRAGNYYYHRALYAQMQPRWLDRTSITKGVRDSTQVICRWIYSSIQAQDRRIGFSRKQSLDPYLKEVASKL